MAGVRIREVECDDCRANCIYRGTGDDCVFLVETLKLWESLGEHEMVKRTLRRIGGQHG